MVVYIVQSHFAVLSVASDVQYAYSGTLSAPIYLGNVIAFGGELERVIGALPVNDAYSFGAVGNVVAFLYLAWWIAALCYAVARCREAMPFILLVGTVILMPYVNKAYDVIFASRYIAFLLPPSFAAMGLFAAEGLAWLGSNVAWRRRAVMAAGSIACAFLIIYPLRSLAGFYDYSQATYRTNAPFAELVDVVRNRMVMPKFIWVDSDIENAPQSTGISPDYAMDVLLRLERVPHSVSSAADIAKQLSKNGDKDNLLVLTRDSYENLRALYPLQPMDADTSGLQHYGFALYRLDAHLR